MQEESNAESYYPSPEQLTDIKLPNELPNFGDLVNKNPIQAIAALRKFSENFTDPYYVGKLLAITKIIKPDKRTEALFNTGIPTLPILYFFFSTMNTEFTTVLDSAQVNFSLIAFPNVSSQLRTIFAVFADTYLAKNQNCRIATSEIQSIAISFVAFHSFFNTKTIIPPEEFKSYYHKSAFPIENALLIYNNLIARVYKINYTFGEYNAPINVTMSGQISCKRSLFKLVKNMFLKISGFWLDVYSDSKAEKPKIKLLLHDVNSTVYKKDEDYILEITSNSKSKLVIGPNKLYDETNYIITGDSKDQLEEWSHVINFVAFHCTLHALIDQEIAKGEINGDYSFALQSKA